MTEAQDTVAAVLLADITSADNLDAKSVAVNNYKEFLFATEVDFAVRRAEKEAQNPPSE